MFIIIKRACEQFTIVRLFLRSTKTKQVLTLHLLNEIVHAKANDNRETTFDDRMGVNSI